MWQSLQLFHFVPGLVDLDEVNNHNLQHSFTFTRDRKKSSFFICQQLGLLGIILPFSVQGSVPAHSKLVLTEIVLKLLKDTVPFFLLPSYFPFFSLYPSSQVIEKVQFNLDHQFSDWVDSMVAKKLVPAWQ